MAHLVLTVGTTEIHFVSPASEGVGIDQDFTAGAGIDVIDAAFDASTDFFQWPPRLRAEIQRLVFPRRRYSILEL
jgi:hypothetical protein